jgi:hypothetical protein
MIDLLATSKELKDYVGQYDTKSFLGRLTELIHYIKPEDPLTTLRGLTSPLRQLYYLAALNITSKQPDQLKYQFSDKEFEEIKNLLIRVEEGYAELFYPKGEGEVDADWLAKRKVAMPTFLSYFNQGPLNYEEQVIERITDYFGKFHNEITAHFGLTLRDFIDIYNLIDSFSNQYLMDKINPKPNDKSWEDFCKEMIQKGVEPWDWQQHLPDNHKNFFEFMDDPGLMQRFKKQKVVEKFGEEKTQKFLSLFTCKREESDFLYYTEKNILHMKPIFHVSEDDFQTMDMKQIIHAIYNTLQDFCVSGHLKEPFYLNRGAKLEDKIERVFRNFFGPNCFVHRGYYTQDKHEQDLLFLSEHAAFIVEAKASKRDEPRRDPDKAYPLIVSNFEETIQKGYDQAYRVKSKFIEGVPLKLFHDEQLKKHIIDIRTKNYHSAFSIVVTLERFGQIQTDLEDLLEVLDDDEFPWSVCIDDLEAFLLQFKRMKGKTKDLVHFLKIRQALQGRLVTADELDVCGGFLTAELNNYDLRGTGKIKIAPVHSKIFDFTYQTENFGFINEKNVELKTSGRYRPIGGY